MLIRKAKLKDLDVLSKMSLSLLKYHQKFDKYFSPSKNADKFLKSFQKKCIYSKNYYLIVSILDGKINGYALAGLSSRPPIFKDRKVGFIYDVYVEEKFRKRGIGKELLEEMFNWLKSNKIKNVELSVHAMNALGNKVWIKENFRVTSHKMHREI